MITGVETMRLDDKLKLAMRAGAYAILNNKRLQDEYMIVSNDNKQSIAWKEAAKYLLCAVDGLNPDEYDLQ